MKAKRILTVAFIVIIGFYLVSCNNDSPSSPQNYHEPTPLSGSITITGEPFPGETLYVDTDLLGGSGNISYKWFIADNEYETGIEVSTGNYYSVTDADVNKYISVSVTRGDNYGSISSQAIKITNLTKNLAMEIAGAIWSVFSSIESLIIMDGEYSGDVSGTFTVSSYNVTNTVSTYKKGYTISNINNFSDGWSDNLILSSGTYQYSIDNWVGVQYHTTDKTININSIGFSITKNSINYEGELTMSYNRYYNNHWSSTMNRETETVQFTFLNGPTYSWESSINL